MPEKFRKSRGSELEKDWEKACQMYENSAKYARKSQEIFRKSTKNVPNKLLGKCATSLGKFQGNIGSDAETVQGKVRESMKNVLKKSWKSVVQVQYMIRRAVAKVRKKVRGSIRDVLEKY